MVLQEQCSKNYECGTPQQFFDNISKSYGEFDLDVCASEENHKCDNYFTIEEDGLNQEWTGKVWMNPPYGVEIPKWIDKAIEESSHCEYIVCLVPGRIDTKWFHKLLHSEVLNDIIIVKGRIKFEGFETGAKFPSVIAVLDKKVKNCINECPIWWTCDNKFEDLGVI